METKSGKSAKAVKFPNPARTTASILGLWNNPENMCFDGVTSDEVKGERRLSMISAQLVTGGRIIQLRD